MPQRTQRLAAYSLIVHEPNVVLVRAGSRSATPGRWYLPGGGVEFGEQPADTVVRETQEETGLSVTVGQPLAALSDIIHNARDGVETHTIRLIYEAVVVGGALQDEREGTSDLARWHAVSALPDGTMPFVHEAIAARAQQNRRS